jgi:hypothetical protein
MGRDRSVTMPSQPGGLGGLPPGNSSPTKPGASPKRQMSTIEVQRQRERAASISSTKTFTSGGAESIFRLLPRESRSAIMRMLAVEPSIRCTLSDLLVGHGNDDQMCACGAADCSGGVHYIPQAITGVDHKDDDGDHWIQNIECCSRMIGKPVNHKHIKVVQEEKPKKKLFH